MPDEPNQSMEALLREAAKMRAAEAGTSFELHLVQRRELQEAVSRQHGSTRPVAARPPLWSNFFLALLPRLALGIGLFVVLGTTIYFSLPKPTNQGGAMTMTKLESRSLESVDRKPADADKLQAGKPYASDSLARSARSEESVRPMAVGGPSGDKQETLSKSVTPPMATANAPADPTLADSESRAKDRAGSALRNRAISPGDLGGASVPPTQRGAIEENRMDLNRRQAVVGNATSTPLPATAPAPVPAPSAAPTKKMAELDSLAPSPELKGPAAVAPEPPLRLAMKSSVAQSVPTESAKEKIAPPAPTEGQARPVPNEFVQEDSRAAFRKNLQSPPLPQVLTRFFVTQSGENIVLTDADGSTYAGAGLTEAGDGHFRANGTNRTLGHAVIIDGWFEAPAPSGVTTIRARITVGGTQFEIRARRPAMP